MNPASTPNASDTTRLRERVVNSLLRQGFRIQSGRIVLPDTSNKDKLRALHQEAVRHSVARSRAGLVRHEDLRKFALEHCEATAKHSLWGTGFRNRRELVRKTLPLLGLSRELGYHGIEREIFVAPLAADTTAFLRGDQQGLQRYHRSAADLFEWFRERWLLPRAVRDSRYRAFEPDDYRLWG